MSITRLETSWLGRDADTGILYFWDGLSYRELEESLGYAISARQIISGTGLTGGGDLSADRTLALDPTIAAGATAGATALQPADTGTAGHKLGYLDGANTISTSWSFTAAPTVPTQSPGDNTTKAASTAFVRAEVAALVASSPSTLDTLKELADALGDDPNFATTMTSALGGKAPTTRTITAGTGLTGGGDLTADRTLNVSATIVSGAAAGATAIQPGGGTMTGPLIFGDAPVLPVVNVSDLATFTDAVDGSVLIVRDAVSAIPGAIVVGGGTVRTIVNFDGVHWLT